MVATHIDTAAGVSRFVSRYAALKSRSDGITERLANFLRTARPMLASNPRRMQVVHDPTGFANAIEAIAKLLNAARDTGALADPWVLAALRRRELVNARVLAGLWSPTSGGDTATDFLSAFFECIRFRPGGAMLPSRADLARGYLVRIEDRPMGDEADRIDITVEGRDYLIGIEVKIDAGLQPDQLGRYQVAIGQRAADRGKRATVIFLSLRHTKHSGVVNARWSDVADAARTVGARNPLAGDTKRSSINHHLIRRFAAHVTQF